MPAYRPRVFIGTRMETFSNSSTLRAHSPKGAAHNHFFLEVFMSRESTVGTLCLLALASFGIALWALSGNAVPFAGLATAVGVVAAVGAVFI